MRNTYIVLVGITERNGQEDSATDWKVILKTDLKNQTYRLGGFELDSSSPVAGSCEHGS
jgi:hypothetical protein